MDVGIGMAIVALGAGAIGAGRRLLERRRAHRELVSKPALDASIAEGTVVRVTGVVRVLERTLEAPLSGATCVVVRSQVRAKGFGLAALRPKETVTMVPFLLEREGEGTVSIEGVHVLLDLKPLSLARPHRKNETERARRQQFVLAHGFNTRQARRAAFAFWETIVEPGMTVSVAGLMMKDVGEPPPVGEELGFRDTAAPARRLAGNVEHPLVIGAPVDRKQLA